MTSQEVISAIRALAQDILKASSRWRDAEDLRQNCQHLLDLPEQIIIDSQGISLRDIATYLVSLSFIRDSLKVRKSSDSLNALLSRAESLRKRIRKVLNEARDALRSPSRD